MDVRFVTSDLRRFHDVRAEALALPLFEGERPHRGAIALVDWRLCGRLGEAIKDGRLTGAAGEHLLLAGRPKLDFEKLFIYGAGPRGAFDDGAFSDAVKRLFGVLTDARIRSTLCLLPGREAGLITPKRAMELFLGAVGEDPAEHDEVTLVEDADAQKEMTPVVDQARRRARARRLE